MVQTRQGDATFKGYEAKLLVFVKGNNLLNQNIRNSTSYLRNWAPEPGRGAEVGVTDQLLAS